MVLTITIDDKKAVKRIQGMLDRVKNKQNALKAISNMMRDDVLDHFKQEKDPSGKWKDLKPATWKWKRSKGKTKMLQNTGALRRGNIPKNTSKEAMVVNAIEYAIKHEKGTGVVPQRRFLWLSKTSLNRIMNYMASYITRGK